MPAVTASETETFVACDCRLSPPVEENPSGRIRDVDIPPFRYMPGGFFLKTHDGQIRPFEAKRVCKTFDFTAGGYSFPFWTYAVFLRCRGCALEKQSQSGVLGPVGRVSHRLFRLYLYVHYPTDVWGPFAWHFMRQYWILAAKTGCSELFSQKLLLNS
jgi:hypothetical protein